MMEDAAVLLKRIQDALVEAFYDPDPADAYEELDYKNVDWVHVIKEAKQRIDDMKKEVGK